MMNWDFCFSKRKLWFISFVWVIILSGLAQKLESESESLHLIKVADMDTDGIPDSVWYDSSNATMWFLFSCNGFEPIEYGYYYDLDTTAIFRSSLNVYEGLFEFATLHMRGRESIWYEYEEESKKFKLISYLVEHNQIGDMSADLETGEFVADWWFYDQEADSIVFLPTLNVSFNLPPVYLGENEPEFIPFDSYRENYTPPSTDTIRFISFYYNPGDLCVLSGTTLQGKEYSACINTDFKYFYRGDLVKITESTCGYFDPDNNTFSVERMVTDLELIEPGKLTLFYQNKSQLIDYFGFAAETLGTLQIEGIDYYLATSGDEKVTKYFTEPGRLAIHFYDIDYKKEPVKSSSDCSEVVIFYEYEGKQTEIQKLLLEITIEHELHFYLYNDKTDTITSIFTI